MTLKTIFGELTYFAFIFIFALSLFFFQSIVNAFVSSTVFRFDFIIIFAFASYFEPRAALVIACFLAGLCIDFFSGGVLGRQAMFCTLTLLLVAKTKHAESNFEDSSSKIAFYILLLLFAIIDALFLASAKSGRFMHLFMSSFFIQVCFSMVVTFFATKFGFLKLSKRKSFVSGSSLGM